MNESSEPSESKGLFSRLRDRLRSRDAEAMLRDTIEEIIEERETPLAPIGAQERTLIANVFKLRELTAYDVMVPRADIVAVDNEVSFAGLMKIANREAHSRLPVYRESLDDVIGMVHVKDLLSCWGREQEFKLEDVLRKVLFVAPSMRVLDLLLEMRKTRLHMALVVDEYGGVDGLVTIEDLVEEIVGEIEDEHDVDDRPRLISQPDGTFLADARLAIGDFEARVGPVLTPEEREADIDTLGGLVVAQAGYLPARGEIVTHSSGYEFEVLEADPRRLKRLRVRPPKPKPEG
ncbi:MAG TPA: hemolysin family protein [Alphaproteobacteria bacterium]|nr:hemolysin family protein [Alphaproteobacteria bacterium]